VRHGNADGREAPHPQFVYPKVFQDALNQEHPSDQQAYQSGCRRTHRVFHIALLSVAVSIEDEPIRMLVV
jgi:hypothetical protein